MTRQTLLRAALATLLAASLAGAAEPVTARQSEPLIRVTGAALSADTVQLGDRFQLRVDVRLASGAVAFVPDSVVGRGFEPFSTVEWTSEATPDGTVQLSLTYPLIAFAVGPVQTPDFELFAARAEESERAGLSRPGQPLGDFDAFVDNVALVPSARLTTVPQRVIEVASVLTMDGTTEMIAPRPPADVAGGDRNWPATLMTLLFGAVVLGVSTATLRDWAAARSAEPEGEGPSPRQVALRSLDELLARGLLAEGRVRDHFSRSSEIARRYVESLDDAWGPAWTGTELMDGLTRGAPADTPDPVPLRAEIAAAERVKFGGARPDRAEGESHVARVREWIASVPEAAPADGGEGTTDPDEARPEGRA